MGLLICVLYVLAEAAVIAAVFYIFVWILGMIFPTTTIPPRVIQLLALALLIYVLVAAILCFSGGGGARLFPWR